MGCVMLCECCQSTSRSLSSTPFVVGQPTSTNSMLSQRNNGPTSHSGSGLCSLVPAFSLSVLPTELHPTLQLQMHARWNCRLRMRKMSHYFRRHVSRRHAASHSVLPYFSHCRPYTQYLIRSISCDS